MDTGKKLSILMLLATIAISVKMIMDQRINTFDYPEVSGETSSWLYRRTIPIENEKQQLVFEYDFEIILDTEQLISSGKMQINCNDIRFLDEDNQTPLNYYVSSKEGETCNSENTKIKIKITALPREGKNIYLLYGNQFAPELGSQDN